MAKELSRSRKLASKVIFEAFKILKESGGSRWGGCLFINPKSSLNFLNQLQDPCSLIIFSGYFI